MKRRKNAVYTGKSKRVSVGRGDRALVNAFYDALNSMSMDMMSPDDYVLFTPLLPDDEIEIIPPEQVNPKHDLQDQAYIIADYCIRKILPELTSLFRWGDEVTPRLRALAPIVNRKTNNAAGAAADAAFHAAFDVEHPAAYFAANQGALTTSGAKAAYYADPSGGRYAAGVVYYALIACIEIGDEAAYNRIIALTNEMLEAL